MPHEQETGQEGILELDESHIEPVRYRWIRYDNVGRIHFREPTTLCYSPPVALDPSSELETWLGERIAEDARRLELEMRQEEHDWAELLKEPENSVIPNVERVADPNGDTEASAEEEFEQQQFAATGFLALLFGIVRRYLFFSG